MKMWILYWCRKAIVFLKVCYKPADYSIWNQLVENSAKVCIFCITGDGVHYMTTRQDVQLYISTCFKLQYPSGVSWYILLR